MVRGGLFRALLVGRPGSGKGSVATRIVRDFPVHWLSSGDAFRRQIREDTAVGRLSREFLETGRMVPDEVVYQLMKQELSLIPEQPLLLDGFPRTVAQAEVMTDLSDKPPLTIVLHLDVPLPVIMDRLTGRWLHPGSGRVYHYSFTPPKVRGVDDVTGEPLVQRVDDTPEVIATRLKEHDKMTEPLVDYYRSKGVLVDFKGSETDVLYPHVRLEIMKHIKVRTLKTSPWSRTVLP